MAHILFVAYHHDAVTQLQDKVGCCQQLHTGTVDTGDGGMIAMTHIKRAQSFAIAFGAGDYHATRYQVVRPTSAMKTIMGYLAQRLQGLFVTFVAHDTHHVMRMKHRVGCHQFVGAVLANHACDQRVLHRT